MPSGTKRILVLALCAACACLAVLMALQGRVEGGTFRYEASGRALPQAEPITLPEGSVDVNRGDAEELMLLPGVGPVGAQAIIDERANGWFYYPEDLLAVRGIGEKTLAGFRDMLKLTEGE